MVHGWLESWDECTHLSGAPKYISHTWSPCGRFVALQTEEAVEIRDALSSERLSTLTNPDVPVGRLAYSPDGSSLACLSDRHYDRTLAIWDIQTGGVTKEIRVVHHDVHSASLTWSLDGGSIGIFSLWNYASDIRHVVCVYGVASDEPLSPVGPFWSHSKPYLWAHDTSFRVMTTRLDNQVYTIEISEVGSVLTEIESFCIEPRGQWGPSDSISIESFSPTTYRISIFVDYNQILVLDVRNLECLLEEESHDSGSHSFSFDGSLFAISRSSRVEIWKYTSSGYTPWRELPIEGTIYNTPPLQFSPTLSSVLVPFSQIPQVWRLDGPPTVARPDSCTLSAVLSHCGTYIATWHQMGSTITITDLYSQTPHFIDTGMKIYALAFTGNILLVLEKTYDIALVAWRLTEGGVVDGIFADRRAGRGDSIWTISATASSWFSFEDQIVIIEEEKRYVVHAYHMGTGEVLDPTRASSHSYYLRCSLWDVMDGRHYPRYCELPQQGMPFKDDWLVSKTTLQDGWVKDPKGKHRLWVLPEWKTIVPGWSLLSCGGSSWLPNITTLRLEYKNGTVIIMF